MALPPVQEGDTGFYRGIEDRVLRLLWEKVIELEIDGLLGFSFGAAVTALFLREIAKSMIWESESAVEGLELLFRDCAQRLRFAAFFSGFLPERDTLLLKNARSDLETCWGTDKFWIPTFHTYGSTDEIIVPERAIELVKLMMPENESTDVFVHEGGHLVPSGAKAVFRDFVRRIYSSKSTSWVGSDQQKSVTKVAAWGTPTWSQY